MEFICLNKIARIKVIVEVVLVLLSYPGGNIGFVVALRGEFFYLDMAEKVCGWTGKAVFVEPPKFLLADYRGKGTLILAVGKSAHVGVCGCEAVDIGEADVGQLKHAERVTLLGLDLNHGRRQQFPSLRLE